MSDEWGAHSTSHFLLISLSWNRFLSQSSVWFDVCVCGGGSPRLAETTGHQKNQRARMKFMNFRQKYMGSGFFWSPCMYQFVIRVILVIRSRGIVALISLFCLTTIKKFWLNQSKKPVQMTYQYSNNRDYSIIIRKGGKHCGEMTVVVTVSFSFCHNVFKGMIVIKLRIVWLKVHFY